ncbi:ABC transporter substrate-binding protein [Acidiferrimicrobium sp. IK]|uniref:ABC transporter substrate-binding protein n=1 Tax=Acidiferrimicrobium sp. IK TaxID=2871700 RepID=UPI0021CB3D43|nr:ABC transporter substrate-binding protein [Acidiferrimicrobium sp. IK]MCU4182891.1 ABC transporter substrate-binding protein [Acidiferrimicrobium sp. IK]
MSKAGSRSRKVAAVGAVVALVAGCGSSKGTANSTPASAGSSGTSAGASSSGKTITIGVLEDKTGLGSSGNGTMDLGVAAGKALATAAGFNVKVVIGDTQTSPAATLAAAHKLVDQDHVDVVLAESAVTFAAAPYLTQQGIPVVGVAQDAGEWITSPNMFPDVGYLDVTKVSTTTGLFMKSQGVTTVGSIGYSISPSSADAARATGISAQAVGLKVGTIESSFPFGGTNVQPVALAMKNSGTDGFTAEVDPNTGFALVAALRQLNATPKVALLATGYGGDLLQAGPAALQDAQGLYFTTSFQPVEMHTAATQKFEAALKAAGVSGEPTYAEYNGYASMALLVQGLQGDGGSLSHAALIASLGKITNFDAAGLLGSHTLNLNDRAASAVGIDGGCTYITKLQGKTFNLVPGAEPICGQEIPGKSAAA